MLKYAPPISEHTDAKVRGAAAGRFCWSTKMTTLSFLLQGSFVGEER